MSAITHILPSPPTRFTPQRGDDAEVVALFKNAAKLAKQIEWLTCQSPEARHETIDALENLCHRARAAHVVALRAMASQSGSCAEAAVGLG